MTVEQRWLCPRCDKTYTSPLPLQHAPAHWCHPPGQPSRIRNFDPEEQPK